MIRKRIPVTVTALLALLLVGMTSCEDWLDIKPESEIILDEYWQTESDVQAVLSACYRGLTEDDVLYRMIVWGEVRSDEIISGTSIDYDIYQLISGNITSSNEYCEWGSFYTVINYCNVLMYYAPMVLERDDNFTQNDLNRITSEALAIRSLCYFYLVRAFKDVPWIEEPSLSDTQDYEMPKDSGEVIIRHLIDDLNTAKEYAVSDFGVKSKNKGYFTKSAVNALLADVYLWSQNYDSCVVCCDEVLADTKLSLVENKNMYSQLYYFGNSTESIFELQFDEDVQENNATYNLYGCSDDPYGQLCYPMTLAYDEETNTVGEFCPFVYLASSAVTESEDDIRSKDFMQLYGGVYYIFKYAGIQRTENTLGESTYRYRSTTPNWIVYRLPDVMLMKAEALVQLGGETNNTSALKLVNQTYLRANANADSLDISTYSTKAKMEELVLRERQRELMFEGKRWFDLMRIAIREQSVATLNTYIEHKSSGSSSSLGAPVLDAMYMPIAKEELESNSQMVQNPYYEDTNSSTR